jgi:hypothetical protein
MALSALGIGVSRIKVRARISGDKDRATLLFGATQRRSGLPAPEADKYDYHY